MSENGEIYTAGKNFTLPLALTALTNSNSDWTLRSILIMFLMHYQGLRYWKVEGLFLSF